MKRITSLILFLLFSFLFFNPTPTDAKIWSKDLVDKVGLDSGYKFSLCSIDLKVDATAINGLGFLSVPEKDFSANPENFLCNKQSGEDILFGNITLYFSQKNWSGGTSREKVIQFHDKLYSLDQYGDIFQPNFIDSKSAYSDLGGADWFSDMPGILAIRAEKLVETDPTAKGAYVPNSYMIVLHDTSGKFTSALFVFDNVAYKISNIVSKVTTGVTLVDYTVSSKPSATLTPAK